MDLNSLILLIAVGIAGYFIIATLRALFWPSPVAARGYTPRHIGDITLEELSKCSGEDPFRPLLVSLRGRVFDVTEARGFYGPGGSYHVYAGREAARALAKMSLSPDDCTAELEDLSEKERATLAQWETKFEAKYKVVGQVVLPKELTLEELKAYDGSDPDRPIYLAARGVVFDVTAGAAFYGPDGAYPFGGRECARALAKFSTEIKDCTDDLEGCTLSEMDALRDWEARFHQKYPVVGRIMKK